MTHPAHLLFVTADSVLTLQMLAAGQAPSAVYGAEHLLRLIVKLPELLPHTGATGEALQLLIRRVEDLLTYMQIHAERLFVGQGGYVLADMYGRAAAAAAMAAPVAVKR
jgi:mortality factor 4-like protein 1